MDDAEALEKNRNRKNQMIFIQNHMYIALLP